MSILSTASRKVESGSNVGMWTCITSARVTPTGYTLANGGEEVFGLAGGDVGVLVRDQFEVVRAANRGAACAGCGNRRCRQSERLGKRRVLWGVVGAYWASLIRSDLRQIRRPATLCRDGGSGYHIGTVSAAAVG